ncbi:MAG TPA: DMT family transporter [Planctomycetota bacterium]|nr:DMT family transporter [Planctomycetota bacterium]
MKGLALLAIIVANIIGGSTYLGQKIALDGLPPATVIALRNGLAMVCLWAWARGSGGLRLSFSGAERRRLALLGMLAYGAPLLLGIIGLRWSTAGNGSILILLEPVSIVVFAWLLLHEHIGWTKALGLGLGLAGALVIVLEQPDVASAADLLSGAHLQGNLILAAHGILWGLYSPLMSPLVRERRSVDVTFASMAWAMLLLVPAALLESPQWHAGPDLGKALAWSAGLGVVGSFGGTLLWVWSLRFLSPATVAPFVFLQPLAGVLAGYLVLDERVTRDALLGGLLIAGAVLLVILGSRTPAAKRPELPTAS